MVEHGSDPNVFQSWLIAIPTILTAVSTWYLRRGTKNSHAQTEAKTTERLDSYNGAIKDKIEELEKEIQALKKSVEDGQSKQVSQAQKYTESMNSLQLELASARSMLRKYLPASDSPISPDGKAEGGPVVDAATPAPEKKFGDVKVVETAKTPIGKVKWEK